MRSLAQPKDKFLVWQIQGFIPAFTTRTKKMFVTHRATVNKLCWDMILDQMSLEKYIYQQLQNLIVLTVIV